MPLSSSSTGTPRSGRSQQPLPSAIMPSILTRIGSERARPRATSRSTRCSESRSAAPEPAPLCSKTSISWSGNARLLLDRLLGPHEGASGRHLPERLVLLRRVQTLYSPRVVDVRHLHRDVLESRPDEQRLVLLLLQRPDNAPGPQPNGLEHLVGELGLGAEEDYVRDGEASSRPKDPVGLGDDLRLVRREVDDAVGDHHIDVLVWQRHVLDVALEELGVLQASLRLVLAGELQHLIGHVHTVGFTSGGDPPGREQHVYAPAATEVEHYLTGRERRQGGRVAAPQRNSDRRLGQ